MVKNTLLKERKAGTLLVSISAVIAGILAGCVLLLAIGKNPFDAITLIAQGALSDPRRIGNTIAVSTQLILVGLSVAFAYKSGLFNIGAPGQYLAVIKGPKGEQTLEIGSVVLATGWVPQSTKVLEPLGYGSSPKVVTILALEDACCIRSS